MAGSGRASSHNSSPTQISIDLALRHFSSRQITEEKSLWNFKYQSTHNYLLNSFQYLFGCEYNYAFSLNFIQATSRFTYWILGLPQILSYSDIMNLPSLDWTEIFLVLDIFFLNVTGK